MGVYRLKFIEIYRIFRGAWGPPFCPKWWGPLGFAHATHPYVAPLSSLYCSGYHDVLFVITHLRRLCVLTGLEQKYVITISIVVVVVAVFIAAGIYKIIRLVYRLQ